MGQFTKPQAEFLTSEAKKIAKLEGTTPSLARALREVVDKARQIFGKS
jgi:hypothetical protein